MHEVILISKNAEKDSWDGEGKKSFQVLPRVGEFIELEIDHIGYMYKVVAIIHPGEPDEYPVDIYVVKLGQSIDVLRDLFENS